jgi:predicted nucleic acid-binding Zn ribbon protein
MEKADSAGGFSTGSADMQENLQTLQRVHQKKSNDKGKAKKKSKTKTAGKQLEGRARRRQSPANWYRRPKAKRRRPTSAKAITCQRKRRQ